MTIGPITIYRSHVWWGWFYPRHVHGWRWGMLYIGRIGIGWTFAAPKDT